MILETYQEQQAIVQPDPPGQSFATVGTVYEDGIALIFNGAEAESLKHYKCNAAVRFAAGQRVRIIEDSGTYVVEYPVGAPAQSIYADSAARAAYASEAGHAETAGKAVTATKADTAPARAPRIPRKAQRPLRRRRRQRVRKLRLKRRPQPRLNLLQKQTLPHAQARWTTLRETMRILCSPTAPRGLCLSGLQRTADGPSSPAPLSDQIVGGSYGYFN